MKKHADKALILIGFQNDYFSKEGILNSVIEESSQITGVLDNTLNLLRKVGNEFAIVVNTPIHFTSDYSELKKPVGILKVISEVGAFKEGSFGSGIIPQLNEFDHFVHVIPGKRGLNAFTNTSLANTLKNAGVKEVVLAGTVTSICIDSTARSAVDLGFETTILEDCTSSRTPFEQTFFCEEVFPLYAKVCHSTELL
jgi:nicotinamidase-related amidase